MRVYIDSDAPIERSAVFREIIGRKWRVIFREVLTPGRYDTRDLASAALEDMRTNADQGA